MLEQLQRELEEVKLNYSGKKNKLRESYNQYKDTKKYSSEFINKKAEEEKRAIQDVNLSMKTVIDDKVNRFIAQMENTKDITGTLEYQTRLSNTLKLIEMTDCNIDSDIVDFMVKAYDSKTLGAIRTAYKDNHILRKACENSNKVILANKMKELGRKYDESFAFSFNFHSLRKR